MLYFIKKWYRPDGLEKKMYAENYYGVFSNKYLIV